MRIVLTGASGFIGSAFMRLALARGHEIGALVRSSMTPKPESGSGNVTWLGGTLESPPWAKIDAFRPEICVHAAWIATPGVYLEAPENRLYLRWSREFVERLCLHSAPRIVALGSCIEYGAGAEPLSEEITPVAPNSLYAECKNELRLFLERWSHTSGLSHCWCRIFYPYGIGEHPNRLCTTLIQRMARNERILLTTPSSVKDYIYIDDLASALLAAVESKASGPLNLGTGTGFSVREIAARIAALAHKNDLVVEAEGQSDPLPYVVADVIKLKSLGWRPHYTLQEGLEKLTNRLLVK